MKSDKPNYNELENLSAYLDHELSEAEENQLRNRLATDENLRIQLETLRLTRYTLRRAPKVRRQRSFTLSPVMVRQQKFAWRAMNFSRMVAAVASVLFAVVVGGEILFGSEAGLIASAPAENAMMMQDEATGIQEDLEMESPIEEEMAAEPAVEMAAPAEAEAPLEDSGESVAEEPSMELGPLPTQTLEGVEQLVEEPPEEPAEEPAAAEITEPGGGGGEPPTQIVEPTFSPSDRALPSEKTEGAELEPDVEMPEGVAGETTNFDSADSMDDAAANDTQPEEQEERVPFIRWIQVVLLGIALISGAVAFYFRRTVQ